jgi:N-glycosylase/DNA lyase
MTCPTSHKSMRRTAEHVIIKPREGYALGPTLCCGQAFRFRYCDGAYQGACGDLAIVAREADGVLDITYSTSRGGAERVTEFLNADSRGQEQADESYAFLARHYPNRSTLLKTVFEYSSGVHILKQPIVETVVGYLLSVQSSVALVGTRLEAIARLFSSTACMAGGRQLNFFPTMDQLKTLSPTAIDSLHLGYRTRWLVELLANIPDEHGLEELRTVSSAERQDYFRSYVGIGPKVAACIDLFAYQGDDAFPVDTWVDRGMRRVLGLTSAQICSARDHAKAQLGPYCGLFGEYLFRFERDHAVSMAGARAQRSIT